MYYVYKEVFILDTIQTKARFLFNCPECNKEVNFKDAFTEEKLGKGIERVSLVCPYCDALEIGYFSNKKIRNNISKLGELKARKQFHEYKNLQKKHQKYFDRFQEQMRGS